MKPSTLSVRKATHKDLKVIMSLVRELAIFEKEEDAFTATLEQYTQAFEENIFQVLLAEDKEEVVGMCLYYPSFSTWKGKMMYLEDFVVRDEHRRKGIGELLFHAFVKVAKEENCRMVKWQVLDWNDTAIAFYKKQKATIEEGIN